MSGKKDNGQNPPNAVHKNAFGGFYVLVMLSNTVYQLCRRNPDRKRTSF